jgi:5-dehydro-2-deoxygluconokinase
VPVGTAKIVRRFHEVPALTRPKLDIIAMGRSSVDLYGQQVGGRLEDMGNFVKAVGGSPTNTSVGMARLGLKPGLITRVGDEHMGRFIREQLVHEGVDVAGVHTDPARFTALAVLGIRDDKNFPLLFYRTDCADAALDESDIDEAYILSAGAILVSGTHFSRPNSNAAQRKAMRIARQNGRRVAFDIDYRPNLWGLAGLGAGEERYIRSNTVSQHLQEVLADCDLIVGTEEEIHIAGGITDTLKALRRIRALSKATIVCKRGPMGCVVFTGAIPDDLDDGIKGPGFPVEVYNVLGAGDAFMAGFLRGWLVNEPLETCCAWANACGAFAVSRLMCSPEYPTWRELQYFLTHGSKHHALRKDEIINHIHWVETRRKRPDGLMVFAIDHRIQIEKMAQEANAPLERIETLKALAVKAVAKVAQGKPGFGMLLDGTYGREALFETTDLDLWIARPLEKSGVRPLTLEAEGVTSLGVEIAEWPVTHTAKVLCFYHPNDPDDVKRGQERELRRIYDACRGVGRELLIELIASAGGPLTDDTMASVMRRLYQIGIKPDWWKLEDQPSTAAWRQIAAVIEDNDPDCRGIVLLGQDVPEAELVAAFRRAAPCARVKGFAVGRTIFAGPARSWLAGQMRDDELVDAMAANFASLVAAWRRAVAESTCRSSPGA